MMQRIIAFFMSIIAFFASLFGINTQKNRVYENEHYGSDARQVMDLVLPDKKEGSVGLILMIHGGAWIAGDKNAYDLSLLKSVANDYGFAAASISYRYLSEQTNLNDLMDDVDNALKAIRAIGEKNGLDINKVLLTGSSAGAHMSLLYAYSRAATAPVKPAAVVSFCGPTDLADDNFYYGNAMGDENFVCALMSYACGQWFTPETKPAAEAALARVSPVSYVNENTVPTVLAHGMCDTTVPFSNAVKLDSLLTAYGVKHDFVIYPNSDHGLSNDPEMLQRTYDLYVQYALAYLS